MNPQRHARIKELFLAACEVPTDGREAWLKQNCGADEEIEREVRKLLLHHSEPHGSSETDSPDSRGTHISVRHITKPSLTSIQGVETRELACEARNVPPGAMLGTRYRIVCLLGRGGMGEVYRADDLVLGQKVALKFLPAHVADDASWLARMRNEVRLAHRVTHPHVCRVYDLEQCGTDVFISMEYVEGEDLRALLRRIGRLPREKAIQLSREVALGLAAIHAKSIVHRDLKPANILIDGRGHGRVTDFGLAATVGQFTNADIQAGTPDYMAPEQLDGREATFKSDIYGLGLLIYELMTGESALQARTLDPSGRSRDKEPAPTPSSRAEPIDPSVERLVRRCLEPKPDDRPASAMLVAASLAMGNDLGTSLDAGETLSAEMVAAAADLRGVAPSSSRWRMALFAILLVAVGLISSRVHPVARFAMTRSPERLAADARAVIRELGTPVPPAAAYGFATRGPSPPSLADAAVDQGERSQLEGETPFFWYRAGDARLTPEDAQSLVFGKARASVDDPRGFRSDRYRILLNPNGRLLSYEQAPHPSLGQNANARFQKLVRLAGLSNVSPSLVVAQSLATGQPGSALTFAGTRNGESVRIEAMELGDQLVSFSVHAARSEANDAMFRRVAWRERVMTVTESVLLAAVGCAAIFLARNNLRRGRSDPRGALRVAAFVFVLRCVSWFLQASHPREIGGAWGMLTFMLAGALAESAFVWLLYVALEPLARRFWPATEVSWSCILRGRFADARIGIDVLTGCVVGAFLSLVFYADLAISATGWTASRPSVRPEGFFDLLLGLRSALGFYLDTLRGSIYMALAFMLLIVLLRAWIKNTLWAGVIAVVVISPILITRGGNEWLSPLLIGVLGVGLCVWAFIRLGLVPIVVAFFVATVLYRTPITFSTQVWYEDLSLLAFLVVGGLALAGFLIGRRSMPAIS